MSKMLDSVDSATPLLPPDYVPSETEEFMNPIMREYFRKKLNDWRKELLSQSDETLQNLQKNNQPEADVSDRASTESQRAFELRTRERAFKLISKIDQALERIENNKYGYCEVTGDAISIQRLEVRPIATMTIAAQETHEQLEKIAKKANPVKDRPI